MWTGVTATATGLLEQQLVHLLQVQVDSQWSRSLCYATLPYFTSTGVAASYRYTVLCTSTESVAYWSGRLCCGYSSIFICPKPEEHQPSGTCNFSRIDNVQLKLTSGSKPTGGYNVYAVNYNVLRIMSGMGGLAYSN